MNCWSVLGIEPTKDAAAVKHAYAARSREVHPEDSPEEFRILHEAYLEALAYTRLTDTEEPAPYSAPVPSFIEGSREKETSYRDIVYSTELEDSRVVNAAVEDVFLRIEQLAASRGSVNDYVAALGTSVTVGRRQTRVCFLSVFASALAEYIKTRNDVPDNLYEAVTLVYEFSPKLAPSPAKDLQGLYNVLRDRKRLLTRKERRLEKLGTFFIFGPFFLILCLFVFSGSVSEVFFPFMLCMVTILVSACITGVKQQKKRAPGPYSEELKKLRKARKLY